MQSTRVTNIVGIVFAAVLFATAPAHAQVASSFGALNGSLQVGQQLTITDQTGVVRSGRLLDLSDRTLRLKVRFERPIELSESSVARIERVTSRAWKGALIGLLTGAVGGALAVAEIPDCPSINCLGHGAYLQGAGLLGAIGAGIGAVIGAAKPARHVIFLAPRPPR